MSKYEGMKPFASLHGWCVAAMIAVCALMVPATAHADVGFEFYKFGAYSISVDGGGSQSSSGYSVDVEKPPGATLDRAYLLGTGTPGNAPPPGFLTVSDGNTTVTPTLMNTNASAGGFPSVTTRWGEVTSELRGILDGLPTGTTALTVTENNAPNQIDGTALVVIWNDPAVQDGLVGVRIGAEATNTAPSFTMTTNPIDITDPSLTFEFGLAITFSTGTGGQVSTVNFEGTQLTTTAGGFDDGESSNGGLFTVGGVGDTLSRADDDERYDVTDLLVDQETDFTVSLPSGISNDYLTLAWVAGDGFEPLIDITTPTEGSAFVTEPSYVGIAPAGATVSLEWLDDTGATAATSTVTADGAGSWSLNTPVGLADGAYTLEASTDISGITYVRGVNFEVDGTPPTLTITNPVDGAATNDDTPTVAGTTEADAAVTIEVRDDTGAVVQTLNVIADAAGDFSVNPSALPDGDYTLEAEAVDGAGNTTPAGPVAFTVDTVAPTLAIDQPISGAMLMMTPSISGTSDADGRTVTVELRQAGMVVSTLTPTVSGGQWSDTPMMLGDGLYSITAEVSDAAGNTTTAGPVTFFIDTVPPAVAINTPPDGDISQETMPTITGTVEAGAMLSVGLEDAQGNGLLLTPPNVTPMGLWDITAPTLTDGTYTITATATDGAGNTATATSTFTVDTTPPVVTIDAPADGATINDPTPTLAGTSSEDDVTLTVEVLDAGGAALETLSPSVSSGAWTVDASTLTEGDYSVRLSAVDQAGNMAMAGPNAFTLDTTPPTVTITAPMDGAATLDNTPTVSGAAEVGTTVEVEVTDGQGNTAQTFNAPVDQAGDWTADAMMLADDTYTITATATDEAGNTATAGPVTLTIDTTPPGLSINAPTSNAVLGDNTPRVAGRGEDGVDVDVDILDDMGMVMQSVTVTPSGGMWSLDAMMLADGTYEVRATSTDAVGNTAMTGPVTFRVDTTAPTVQITSPADMALISDVRPEIAGITEGSSQVDIEIQDSMGNVVHTTTTVADPVTGMFARDDISSDLADDTYTIEATATDQAGNVGTGSSTFTVDTTLPPVAITSPMAMEVVGTTTPDITGTTDAGLAVEVILEDDQMNELDRGMVTADANGDWSYTVQTPLPEDLMRARADATSASGVVASDSVVFRVDITAPTVTLDAPADGAVTTDTTPMVRGTVESGAELSVVIFDEQGNEVEALTPTIDLMGNWEASPMALQDGTYDAIATATDSAGNESEAGPNTFVVDTTAPLITIDMPASNAFVTTAEVGITGEAEAGLEVTVTVTSMSGDVVATRTPMAAPDSTYATQTDPLTDGVYRVTAEVTDAAGNMAMAGPVRFTLDTMPPALTITSPVEGEMLTETQPTIEGTADAGIDVEVFIDGTSIGTVGAGPDGTWELRAPDALEAGPHTADASAMDDAGNTVNADQVNFQIEVAQPDLTITSPAEGASVTGPDVMVTGEGVPGEEVVVTADDSSATVTVAEDGTWSAEITIDEEGEQVITAASGNQEATVTVVVDILLGSEFELAGGGCATASAGAAPASWTLWLLGLVLIGGVCMRRRMR